MSNEEGLQLGSKLVFFIGWIIIQGTVIIMGKGGLYPIIIVA